MDPASWFSILASLLLLSVVALASSAQAAISRITKPHAQRLAEEGRPGALTLLDLVGDEHRLELSLALLRNLGILLLLGLAWSFASLSTLDLSSRFFLLLATVILIFIAILIGRGWAITHPQGTGLFLAGPAYIATLPLRPLVGLGEGLQAWLVHRLGGEAILASAEEEIRVIVGEHEQELPIDMDEKEMIASIFQFGQTLVREVMIPRPDMAAVEVNTPLSQAVDLIIQAGHSRLPVYREDLDNISGILHVMDLLRTVKDGSINIPLEKILRPAYFVPETNKVDELLEEMQAKRVPMAIVVDEYGGTAGLVTVEDLIEEIVGEIHDEHDSEGPSYQKVNANEYLLDARMDPQSVNRLLDIGLPTEEGDTLAGLILSHLGRVPAMGEEVVLDGVKITVLGVVGRRIRRVRITKPPSPA